MGEKFHGKEKILDLIFEVGGIFIMSLGIHCFLVPANIAPGGVSGMADFDPVFMGTADRLDVLCDQCADFILSCGIWVKNIRCRVWAPYCSAQSFWTMW